jgi:hypothetical protein
VPGVSQWPTLVANVGKDWVLDAKTGVGKYGIDTAVNHGWYSSKAPYLSSVPPHPKLWQDRGAQHNKHHKDPSQKARLMRRNAMLYADNVCTPVRVEDVLRDPKLCGLLVWPAKPLVHVRQP